MIDVNETRNGRDEVEDLLPWYAAGTLDASDTQRVETWLRRSPDAMRRLEIVRAEQEAGIAASEMRGAPSPGALDRLMSSLPASRKSRIRAAGAGWLESLFGGSGMRMAGALAALVILLQAAALTYVVVRNDGSKYQSASGGSQEIAGGTRALVRFSDTATSSDISALLQEAGAEIIGGPKPGGVYVIRLSAQALSDAERDARLKQLQGEGAIVIFTAPAE